LFVATRHGYPERPFFVIYAEYYSAYSEGERYLLPFRLGCLVGVYLRCYFFTPVYSSTVFVLMVVVTLDVSETCVYVAVVLMVRHALHDVIPTLSATLTITANSKMYFFILFRFLIDKFNDLVSTEGGD